jgi:hypothetical protein
VAPGDYTQVAGAVVSRLHIRQEGADCAGLKAYRCWTYVPFIGLGGIHASLKNSNGSTVQDMSYYAVLGGSLEVNFLEQFGTSFTYVHNFHNSLK